MGPVMGPPEPLEPGQQGAPARSSRAGEQGRRIRRGATQEPTRGQPYGRYVGALALVILALITLNTILTKPNGLAGLAPGSQVPPFAVPLVLSNLEGDADVATRLGQGRAGKVPACELRKPQVLNVCALYERGPLVLALFVDGGGCPGILSDMEAVSGSFPAVQFAAVSIRGDRNGLRRLVRSRGLSFPVGYDRSGDLASLYKLATCQQLTFVLPGGVVASRALLERTSVSDLRVRVGRLLAAAHATPTGG